MSGSDDSLVTIYRAGDVAVADYLAQVLKERGIASWQQAAGMDGLPPAFVGTVGYRIMVTRGDAEAHAEEIAAAIREVEADLGIGRSE